MIENRANIARHCTEGGSAKGGIAIVFNRMSFRECWCILWEVFRSWLGNINGRSEEGRMDIPSGEGEGSGNASRAKEL